MLPPKTELLLLPLLLRIPILVFPWFPKIFPFSPAVPFHIPANSFASFMQSNQATKSISGDRPNSYRHWRAFQTYFVRRGKMILFYYQKPKQNIKQLQIYDFFFFIRPPQLHNKHNNKVKHSMGAREAKTSKKQNIRHGLGSFSECIKGTENPK